MKQTHLLRNSYRFLIDLVYPNRCPCCNQVIAWDAWICEACQIETALNPDTICSGCGKPFDDCMCSESLAFEGAMAVSRYEGRARQGILQLKQAENLNFANYTGAVLGERILQKPDWMMPLFQYRCSSISGFYGERIRRNALQMRFLLSQRFRFVRICFGKSRAEFRSIR